MASTRCYQLLTVILLLTSVLVATRQHAESYQPRLRHMTRHTESYSPRLRRDDAEEEGEGKEGGKLPDTNGMFFGKRTSTGAKSPDTLLSRSSQLRRRIRQMCKRGDMQNTQLARLFDCAMRLIPKHFWCRTSTGYQEL